MKRLIKGIQGLLNKVNRVTCSHRHGQKVSKSDLDGLANRQIDFTELFESYKDKPTKTLYAIKDTVSGEYWGVNILSGGFNNATLFSTKENAERVLKDFPRKANFKVVTLTITEGE